MTGAVELVLLRHGQTDWNRIHRIQGQSQSQLDELGRAQAAAVAPVVAAMKPTVLWVSDADRARQTAEPVVAATGLTPVYDPRLREYFFGAREGLLHHEFEADDPQEYAEFRRANWDAVTGVETFAAVAARMTAALSGLAAAVEEAGGTVGVAVSHGAAIRTGTVALLGWPPDHALSLRGMANCAWVVLRRDPEPDAGWRLVTYNRTLTPTPSPATETEV